MNYKKIENYHVNNRASLCALYTNPPPPPLHVYTDAQLGSYTENKWVAKHLTVIVNHAGSVYKAEGLLCPPSASVHG